MTSHNTDNLVMGLVMITAVMLAASAGMLVRASAFVDEARSINETTQALADEARRLCVPHR